MKNNIFVDTERLKCIDTFRIIYLFLFVGAFLITEVGRNVYRPYIYENNIHDYGIADSIGNLGGIIVQIYFGLLLLNSPWPKNLRLILLYITGYILYEFLQPYLPRGTFDWLDVYGTVLGGIVATLILLFIKILPIQNKVYYKF